MTRLCLSILLVGQAAAAQATSPADSALARSGFFERASGRVPISGSARFITPRELSSRPRLRISHLLAGELFIETINHNGRAVLQGRRRHCTVSILLDGVLVRGLAQENLDHKGTAFPESWYVPPRLAIDDLIDMSTVQAVEIYPSGYAIPADLQRYTSEVACPAVFLWTGSRAIPAREHQDARRRPDVAPDGSWHRARP